MVSASDYAGNVRFEGYRPSLLVIGSFIARVSTMKRFTAWYLAGWFLATAASAFGQTSASVISQQEAREIGLQRIWMTQVQVDAGFGELVHLTQHVSSTTAVTVHEITYDGGRFVFSERDLDRFGQPLGVAKAKRMAEVKFADLTDLKVNPKVQTITVPQITLYAVTNAGIVQAIDAETGRTIWKIGIGNPRHPTEAAGASDDYVAAISGSDLYLLKSATGDVIWKRRVIGAPGAGAAISPVLVFVPMVNGAMEAYQIEDTRFPPSIYRSQGRAMFQPIYTGTNVVWPTDRGHLYVTGALTNRINFRLEANDAIAAPATIMQPGKLIVSSIDGFVYCVHESSSNVLWRFSSGEPIIEPPIAYGDTVFVVTTDGTVFAIDGELGQERWSVSGMHKVVGASKDKVYCLSDARRLTVLDRQNGTRLGSLPAMTLDLPYINTQTDRLILANARGTIQCLREIQSEFPYLHIGLTKQETETPKLKKPTKPAEGEPAADKGDVDPFGAGPAADTKREPMPPAKGDKMPDDPFGE